jgi:hypothetical protein
MREWIAGTALEVHNFLMPAVNVILAFVLPVLVLLALFKKSRGVAGELMIFVSFIIGAATWVGGVAITFSSFGWLILIVGLLFFGIGVVPAGMLGAGLVWHDWALAGELLLGAVLTVALRFGGASLRASWVSWKERGDRVVAVQ